MGFTRITPDTKIKPLPQPQSSPSAGDYLSNTQNTSGMGNGSNNIANPDMFKMLLSAGVMSGDLTPSAGTFMMKALLPPQETATTVSKRNQAKASKGEAYDKATRLANEALAILDQKNMIGSQKNITGFSVPQMLQEKGINPLGILNLIPGWGLNKDRANLNAKLGQLSGITAFDEAGKALTATELGIVGGKVPTVGKDEEVNKIILQQILNDVEAKRNEYLFNQVGL